MRRSFTQIEFLAQQLRTQLLLASDARLDPRVVLAEIEADLFESAHEIPGLDPATAERLCEPNGGFSGAGLEVLGQRVVLLNPSHTLERRRVTTMEEVAHFLFGHIPTRINLLHGVLPAREYHREQEQEAYAFAAASLLPSSQVKALVDGRRTMAATIEHFGVSDQLIEYRVKTTGMWSLYRRAS